MGWHQYQIIDISKLRMYNSNMNQPLAESNLNPQVPVYTGKPRAQVKAALEASDYRSASEILTRFKDDEGVKISILGWIRKAFHLANEAKDWAFALQVLENHSDVLDADDNVGTHALTLQLIRKLLEDNQIQLACDVVTKYAHFWDGERKKDKITAIVDAAVKIGSEAVAIVTQFLAQQRDTTSDNFWWQRQIRKLVAVDAISVELSTRLGQLMSLPDAPGSQST